MAPPRSHQNQVRDFIGDILDVLERYHGLSLPIEFSHGLLSLFAQELGVKSPKATPKTASEDQEERPPATRRSRGGRRGGARPSVAKKGKRQSGGKVPTEQELLDLLSRKKLGLKELANRYGVHPWTPLQHFLERLEKEGKIEKIARRYRVTAGARSGKRAKHDRAEEAIEAAERKKEESQMPASDASPAEQDATKSEHGDVKAGKSRKQSRNEQETPS